MGAPVVGPIALKRLGDVLVQAVTQQFNRGLALFYENSNFNDL